MNSRIKLKSCPFCGGEAQLLMVGKRADGGEEWYVGCENLNCSLHPHSTIPYASAEIAAEAWNRRVDNTHSAPVGDCAKLREALSDASHAMFNFLKTQYGGYEEMANALDKARVTLAKPPRNCDRFGGDIDKLREACARERGLNPEEDFPEVFCEWLLAKAKGENDVK